MTLTMHPQDIGLMPMHMALGMKLHMHIGELMSKVLQASIS